MAGLAELMKEACVCEQTGLSEAKGMVLLKSIFHSIPVVAEKDKLVLKSIGTFTVKERDARDGRNPKTQEPIKIKARRFLHFKPSRKGQ